MAIVDVVRWMPQGDQTVYASRYPESNLSTLTQLIVMESQEAVLFSKGQIVGKFGPGKHTLSTENLPILRSLYGLPFGGANPFTAEVWFVNKVQPYNIDWSIDRMDVHDADYNTGIPLVAKGRYGLRITDAERFLVRIVGTKVQFNQDDLTDQFFGEFSTKTKSTIIQFMLANRIGIKQISAHLDSISEFCKTGMLPFWENLGFELMKFYVTSIAVDDSTEVGRRVLDAISKQSAQSIGGYTWQQSQAFEVAKDAVEGMSGSNTGIIGAVLAANMMGGLGGVGGGMMAPQYNAPSLGGTPPSVQGTPFTPGAPGTPGAPIAPGGAGVASVREVFCSNCSKQFSNTNKFCPHCGDPYNPCPKCGTDNDSTAKRCISCGSMLVGEKQTCIHCNAIMVSGNSFCGNCGKAQAEDTCTRCGTQLPAGEKFCPKCGQKR
jgi:membrane protease subunit (stomatin/prohibitin family)